MLPCKFLNVPASVLTAVHAEYETIVPPKAVPMPLVELARDVYRKERTVGPTGTIQGLTKAQVAFTWAVVSSSTSVN